MVWMYFRRHEKTTFTTWKRSKVLFFQNLTKYLRRPKKGLATGEVIEFGDSPPTTSVETRHQTQPKNVRPSEKNVQQSEKECLVIGEKCRDSAKCQEATEAKS